jgi:hypothetical protein
MRHPQNNHCKITSVLQPWRNVKLNRLCPLRRSPDSHKTRNPGNPLNLRVSNPKAVPTTLWIRAKETRLPRNPAKKPIAATVAQHGPNRERAYHPDLPRGERSNPPRVIEWPSQFWVATQEDQGDGITDQGNTAVGQRVERGTVEGN